MPDKPINLAAEAAKAVPSTLAIVITDWMAVPLQTWLSRLGLIFLLLQAGHLLWRWRRDIRRERAGQLPASRSWP